MPSGSEWVHCGHAIQMHDLNGSHSRNSDSGEENAPKIEMEIKVRRFDRDTTTSNNGNSSNLLGYVQSMVNPKNIANGVLSSSQQGKMDHEIASYVEKFTRSDEQWFTDFCEWKGKGVSGANDEIRRLA
jgi:hypothetical protein